ncbi:MAG: UvrD-helicase domain-containing protein [Okeania sp. SIO2C2]|uniref:UvrD-helicase domain-containing protein n=1 Tax=Okeania sp. SIO2C2 TaxID=2607787 RepID=UPI0013B66948|nr:UvrD-helicase domain-containing protein [Okeania sp. SIO2C2]NEP85619.1 UvrD-helicase domain-containing protein [Okeania sp. SIO2C2]
MAYHSRGGVREGAGRPSKAPTKTIRIEENLADKIKKLTTKLESNYILSKWESVENFLLHNQTLPQQDTNNELPPKLSKALEDKALVELLDKIFSKFSPVDFIAYWSDIDLTEIEPTSESQLARSNVLCEATTEKPYTVSTPEVNLAKDATLEKSEVVSVVEFSDYKSADGNFLTKEQFNILEAVRDRTSVPLRDRLPQAEKKGLLIEALAGTGKSTMLAEIAKVLKSEKLSSLECRFVVFGRKNQQDLANKLSEIKWEKSVQTLNSLGYEMLRDALGKSHKQFRLNNGKYEKLAQDKGYIDRYNKWGEKIPGQLQIENHNGEIAIKSKGDFVDLLDKMRLHCYFVDEISSDEIWEIADKYGIEIYKNRLGEITEAVCDVLEAGLDDGINKLNIDFLDQTWLLWHDQNVYKNVFNKWSNKLKVVSIDECQDTDLLQIEFIKLLHKSSNNFIIACGDKFQAIYSFRGCLTDGIDVIAKKFNCDKMPLTTNWRCGKKHLELVRDIYPHIDIKPAPTAPDGEIRIIKENHFLDIFDESDRSLSFFGICRKNAPLLIFAIRLLTAGYAARIKDRNLGAKLLNKVKEVVKGNYDVDTFLNQVDSWFEFQANSINKLPEKVQEQKLTELRDYRDCLVALFAKFQPKSLNDWKTEIDKIFDESTTTKKIIDLYTIHSGKGGEGHYTFILYPENMPIEFEKQSREERQQEQHMIYVALTRCLARAKGGILWLVLEGKKDAITYPKWLPHDYRKLWKDDKGEDFETDFEDLEDEDDIEF